MNSERCVRHQIRAAITRRFATSTCPAAWRVRVTLRCAAVNGKAPPGGHSSSHTALKNNQ